LASLILAIAIAIAIAVLVLGWMLANTASQKL
jgi:hypothetical protein